MLNISAFKRCGFFKVRDGSVYPDAGTRIITVVFLPTDANYAEQTCEIEIYVAPADATVTFTKLQTSYTGTDRKNQISYTVSPSNVRVSITFTSSDNSIVSDPVNAGNYRVQAVSLDSNYRVTNTTFADGSNPYFTIAKASVDRAVAPKANAITVGDSLIFREATTDWCITSGSIIPYPVNLLSWKVRFLSKKRELLP